MQGTAAGGTYAPVMFLQKRDDITVFIIFISRTTNSVWQCLTLCTPCLCVAGGTYPLCYIEALSTLVSAEYVYCINFFLFSYAAVKSLINKDLIVRKP